jgi:hypothetical protein
VRYYILERDGANRFIASDRAQSLLDAGMAYVWHCPEGSATTILKLKGS